MKTTKDLQAFFKANGFNLNVKKCTGTLKQYLMVGARKLKGEYPRIDSQELTDFLNKHFTGFEGKKFERFFSFNGGLSTLIKIA